MKKYIFYLLSLFIALCVIFYFNKSKIKHLCRSIYYSAIEKNTNKKEKKEFSSIEKPTSKNGKNGFSELNSTWGIDLSHHQSNIAWNLLVEKNKPDFIFFKSTEGMNFIDSKFIEYSNIAKSKGIRVGAYHFYSYLSDGKKQAKNFISFSRLKKGDLFPVLDLEFKNSMPGYVKIVSEVKSFCNEIKKEYGVNPIIYCEYDYFNKYLKKDFSNYYYWISDFYREPRCKWIIWQTTDKANIFGVKGGVDINILNSSINLKSIILR